MPGSGLSPYAYAIIRIVPHIERGECVNAGVLLFCRQHDFLRARIALDERRLASLAPDLGLEAIRPHLDAFVRIAAGDPDAGPIAALPASERFGWLVAPASTTIQPSIVHTGLCADPSSTLDHLVDELLG
ncbi:MAG: hypothetical protein QOD61_1418 [Solirubrobacteraceae bacterium]|nr:hypothetical protein [Solirubrobacteraceae bacterium]